MGQTAHLVLRHQTWHWRRRVPSEGLMTGIDDTDLRDPLKGRGDGFATGGGNNADGSAMVHDAGEMRQSTDGGPVHRSPLLPPDLDHDIRAFIAAHPAPPARMTTARAASDIRATIAQGVQGAFHDAARRNDGAMAQGHVQRIVDNMVAEGHAFQLGDRTVLERHSLPVLAAVHEQVASRERKPQPIELGSPGPMSLPQPANVTPPMRDQA